MMDFTPKVDTNDKQITEEGKRIANVSEALGITEQTTYRWLWEYDKYGVEAFKGSGNARVDKEFKINCLRKRINSWNWRMRF